jgi:hypothetical protein
MIECRELAGKTIRRCQINKDGTDGPEIHIEFTDETTFSVCLKTNVLIETTNAHGPKELRVAKPLVNRPLSIEPRHTDRSKKGSAPAPESGRCPNF